MRVARARHGKAFLVILLPLSCTFLLACSNLSPSRGEGSRVSSPPPSSGGGSPLFSVQSKSGLAVRIGADSRIELVAIVCRLAGYPEYSVDWPLRYLNELGKWFAPYIRHPTVRMARSLLIEGGIGYNAPLSLVVHADPDTLEPLVPLDPLPEKLDTRWTPATASSFLAALADFSRDADFPGFFKTHGHLYTEVGERISTLVHKEDLIPWMEDFFGLPCRAERNILISYLTGFRHYGLSVRLPCGCLALNPVLGVSYWTHAEFRAISPLLSAIIIHEFSHAFVDDLVDEVWNELEPTMNILISGRRGLLQPAYANAASLAYETVVRACDAWFTFVNYGSQEFERLLALHESEGFDLVEDLVYLLADYASDRGRYPEFRDFMPWIVGYFREKAGG